MQERNNDGDGRVHGYCGLTRLCTGCISCMRPGTCSFQRRGYLCRVCPVGCFLALGGESESRTLAAVQNGRVHADRRATLPRGSDIDGAFPNS